MHVRGQDTVRRRGRWGSDVAEIYQRVLLAVQLDLSATLGEAISEDLEQLCSGWLSLRAKLCLNQCL